MVREHWIKRNSLLITPSQQIRIIWIVELPPRHAVASSQISNAFLSDAFFPRLKKFFRFILQIHSAWCSMIQQLRSWGSAWSASIFASAGPDSESSFAASEALLSRDLRFSSRNLAWQVDRSPPETTASLRDPTWSWNMETWCSLVFAVGKCCKLFSSRHLIELQVVKHWPLHTQVRTFCSKSCNPSKYAPSFGFGFMIFSWEKRYRKLHHPSTEVFLSGPLTAPYCNP